MQSKSTNVFTEHNQCVWCMSSHLRRKHNFFQIIVLLTVFILYLTQKYTFVFDTITTGATV